MITKTKVLSIIAVSLMLTSCANKQKLSSGPDYMILDEVVFVNKFPHSAQLNDPERINTEIPGGLDFVIRDTLIIFSTEKPDAMWEFFSLPDFKYLGGYLRKGNGPTEFLQTRWLYKVMFSEKDGQLFSSIYDFDKGRILEMNITNTLAKNESDISIVGGLLPELLLGFVILDDTTFFCRELTDLRTQQNRFLLKNGIRSVPNSFAKMNRAHIAPDEDFNILSSITAYDRNSSRIVEAPVKLNYINIYSLDGNFGKTVCVEEKIDNISEIQLLDRRERRNTFGSVRVYDNMFGVRWNGDNDVSQEDALSKIMFFDMDGKPLLELKPDRPFTTFDIDFKRGHLYTHSYQTEDLYKYDIGKYLGELK